MESGPLFVDGLDDLIGVGSTSSIGESSGCCSLLMLLPLLEEVEGLLLR